MAISFCTLEAGAARLLLMPEPDRKLGVTLPGWAEQLVGKGHDIWNPIFLWLGVALALAGLLLLPQWNRLPTTAKAGT